MKPTAGLVTGKSKARAMPAAAPPSSGFTLVELLSVVAIMAIIFGLLAVSITQTRGPAVQVAAGQVASGLGLARQIAIAKNTRTRFVISHTNAPGMPDEPFRYWTVLSYDDSSSPPRWLMEKEWEPLPQGVVFLNIAGASYGTITGDPIPLSIVGQPIKPIFSNEKANEEYKYFSSFNPDPTLVRYPNGMISSLPANMPFLGFRASGQATFGRGGADLFFTSRQAGLRVASGSVADSMITLESNQNYTYVEVDMLSGKSKVRPRDSYRYAR
jgi:prepilin-type N-terminal cleavage/methylation domain-containing protein